jgi:hypothetical protein
VRRKSRCKKGRSRLELDGKINELDGIIKQMYEWNEQRERKVHAVRPAGLKKN